MRDLKFIFQFHLNLKNSTDGKNFISRYSKQSFFSILKKIWAIPINIFKSKGFKLENEIQPYQIWFFVSTLNQYNTISEIVATCKTKVVVVTNNYELSTSINDICFLDFSPLKFSIFKYPIYLFRLLFLQPFYFFQYFLSFFGYIDKSMHYLKKFQPQKVVFTNDHNPEIRGMLLACLKCKIPTFYIQHASVSHLFPPLAFDMALLEGEDAKCKYLKMGNTHTKIELVGIPRIEKYLEYRKCIHNIQKIGLAYNTFDDLNKLKELIVYIKNQLPNIQFILRRHPGDERDTSILNELEVNWSDSRNEISFEFINKIDLLISGESNIHLEASMLNRPCVYYQITNTDFFDYYGFVSKNISKYIETLPTLVDYIKQYKYEEPEPYLQAAYYNAAIKSDFEGKSINKIVNFILN